MPAREGVYAGVVGYSFVHLDTVPGLTHDPIVDSPTPTTNRHDLFDRPMSILLSKSISPICGSRSDI